MAAPGTMSSQQPHRIVRTGSMPSVRGFVVAEAEGGELPVCHAWPKLACVHMDENRVGCDQRQIVTRNESKRAVR